MLQFKNGRSKTDADANGGPAAPALHAPNLDQPAIYAVLCDDILTCRKEIDEQRRHLSELQRFLIDRDKRHLGADAAAERQVRATALDLAIKAVPDQQRGDPSIITDLAAAFLGWLKATEQANG